MKVFVVAAVVLAGLFPASARAQIGSERWTFDTSPNNPISGDPQIAAAIIIGEGPRGSTFMLSLLCQEQGQAVLHLKQAETGLLDPGEIYDFADSLGRTGNAVGRSGRTAVPIFQRLTAAQVNAIRAADRVEFSGGGNRLSFVGTGSSAAIAELATACGLRGVAGANASQSRRARAAGRARQERTVFEPSAWYADASQRGFFSMSSSTGADYGQALTLSIYCSSDTLRANAEFGAILGGMHIIAAVGEDVVSAYLDSIRAPDNVVVAFRGGEELSRYPVDRQPEIDRETLSSWLRADRLEVQGGAQTVPVSLEALAPAVQALTNNCRL